MKHSPHRPSVNKASQRGQGIVMRLSVFAAALCLSAIAVSAPPPADAAARKATSIPAQDMGSALVTLEKQRNFQIVFISEDIKNLKTQGASGQLTFEEALKQILEGTGLTYKYLDSDTVTVMPTSQAAVSSGMTSGSSVVPTAAFMGASDVHLAQADAPVSQSPPVVTENSNKTETTKNSDVPDASKEASVTRIEEIVVSAQKRDERLQDVPVPVTAISAESLLDSNQLRLQDYYTSVPALSMTSNYNGAPTVTIRGLSTGSGTNPTVGIVVDDVPFGSTTALGGGFYVPEIDPSELARVEVLRGPQGTLYGASSLGGLIKFVTVDPTTDEVSGRVQAGTSGVYNGTGAGFNFRGAINVPLSDTFAVRASGFSRKDPGFIDDPTLGIDGVNETRVDGGRLSALWKPSREWSVKLGALFQDTRVGGSSDVDLLPGLGDLEQSTPRWTGTRNTRIEAYNANATAKFGDVDVTSVSGYTLTKVAGSTDLTPALGSFSPALYGVTGAALIDDIGTNKFTQELRFSRSLGRGLDWLFGAFYTHEGSHYNQAPTAVDFDSGEAAGLLYKFATPTTYEEYAAFGDLTFHLTDRFDLQLGARESRNQQTYSTVETGPLIETFFGAPSPLVPPAVDSKANSFTYLVTPSFRLAPDILMYARLASGYRPGGPNQESTLERLPTFGPDKTQNYEFGLKGDLLDRAFSFDTSLYYIDWKDVQIQLVDPVSEAGFYVNATKARSKGMEVSMQARPVSGMTVGAWVAFNDAALSAPFPPSSLLQGGTGSALPYSSRFSGNFSVQETIPLTASVAGFVAGELSYVGSREGNFQLPSIARQTFPAYAKTDLRAGAKYESWAADVFVNNVADKRGVLTGGVDNINPVSFDYIQPRTVGLLITRTF